MSFQAVSLVLYNFFFSFLFTILHPLRAFSLRVTASRNSPASFLPLGGFELLRTTHLDHRTASGQALWAGPWSRQLDS
jgi:hypothetical protein